MSTVHANVDLDAYSAQLDNYVAEHDHWQAAAAAAQAAYEQQLADYEQAHAAWEANPISENEGVPVLEPQPPAEPTPPPEPQPPAAPPVYSTRDVADPEMVTTPGGSQALAMPGRVALSSDGGASEVVISTDELAAHYTDTNEPLPAP